MHFYFVFIFAGLNQIKHWKNWEQLTHKFRVQWIIFRLFSSILQFTEAFLSHVHIFFEVTKFGYWTKKELTIKLFCVHCAAAPTGLVVLHGLHGCGKSSLALALAQRFQNDPCCRACTLQRLPSLYFCEAALTNILGITSFLLLFELDTLYMGCSQYTGVRIETVKAKWRAMFTEALKNGPSVIVLDDLDLLVPPEQELVCIMIFQHHRASI